MASRMQPLAHARGRRFRSAWRLAALAVALCLSLPVQAAPRDPILGRALFDEAQKALDSGDWVTACGKFQASLDANPGVSTLLNLGRCHDHFGKLTQAWDEYHHALTLNRDTDSESRRDELERIGHDAIAALEPRLPKLTLAIASPPAGVTIALDGKDVPAGALGAPLPIDPGNHEVVANAPGYQEQRKSFEIAEGQQLPIELTLTPIPPPPKPFAIAPPERPRPRVVSNGPESRDPRRAWAWIALGGAVAFAAAGTAFAIDARRAEDDITTICGPSGECLDSQFTLDDIDRFNGRKHRDIGLSVAFFVGAAASTAASTVLFATGSARRSRKPASAWALPWASPTGLGVVLGGGFW